MPPRVLSIQSAVAYGHVGNGAAGFVLQRLGFELVRLDTVTFSNHPAHGGFRGGGTPPERLRELLDGLDGGGFLAGCSAVLSGYLGTAAMADMVLDGAARLRAARPEALYCCDPVLGDLPRGLYVAPDIPQAMRERLIPIADIVAPNAFELETLAARPARTREAALAAARLLLARGPRLVLVTGLELNGAVGAMAVRADAAWLAAAPRIDAPAWGAGDAFTALFLARWLEKPDPARALSLAVSAIHAVLAATAAAGVDELALVPAQDLLLAPTRLFPAERIA